MTVVITFVPDDFCNFQILRSLLTLLIIFWKLYGSGITVTVKLALAKCYFNLISIHSSFLYQHRFSFLFFFFPFRLNIFSVRHSFDASCQKTNSFLPSPPHPFFSRFQEMYPGITNLSRDTKTKLILVLWSPGKHLRDNVITSCYPITGTTFILSLYWPGSLALSLFLSAMPYSSNKFLLFVGVSQNWFLLPAVKFPSSMGLQK